MDVPTSSPETLVNALSAGLGMDKTAVAEAVAAAELPPTIRGEALSLSQFALLSNRLYDAGEGL